MQVVSEKVVGINTEGGDFTCVMYVCMSLISQSKNMHVMLLSD